MSLFRFYNFMLALVLILTGRQSYGVERAVPVTPKPTVASTPTPASITQPTKPAETPATQVTSPATEEDPEAIDEEDFEVEGDLEDTELGTENVAPEATTAGGAIEDAVIEDDEIDDEAETEEDIVGEATANANNTATPPTNPIKQ